MMNRTKIEWALNPDGTPGYTWNPITGCLNGCEYCYARRLANGRLRSRYLANTNIASLIKHEGNKTFRMGIGLKSGHRLVTIEEARADPFYPRFCPDKLSEPVSKVEYKEYSRPVRHALKLAKGKGIFVCDMSDLFGIGVPEEWTRKVLNVIEHTSYNRYYLLTKQPQNLIKFSPFPENCWVGVTATDYESFYFGAIKYLAKVEAKVKYISFEPLLGGMGKHIGGWLTACLIDAGIKWVIIGACTGSESDMRALAHKTGRMSIGEVKPFGNKWTLQPKIEWVKEIVEACVKARIPVFLKDNLLPLIGKIGNCTTELTAIRENKPNSHSVVLRQELPSA